MRYIIRDREAGNEIEWCSSIEEAKNIIAKWEEEDIREGIFKPDFYEIYDSKTEEIIWRLK